MRQIPHLFSFIVAMLLFAVPAWSAPQPERRVALVIGNASYPTAPLKNPVNDASDVAAALKRLGFEVTLLRDASMQQMEDAVRAFGLALRRGGLGLFYFAGHGVQVAGENYLVPVNAVIQSEGDVKYGCLNAGLVLAKMEDAGNGPNVVILDACRNNPFARSFRSAEAGLARMDAPTGSLIAYATAPGKVAADGEGRNGLYTQHLLRNIGTPGLSISDLFMNVREAVVRDSGKKQVPWENTSLIGRFSLAGQAAAAGAGAAPAAAPAPNPPLPPKAGVRFDDIEAQSAAKAEDAARKQWAQWQASMRKDVGEAEKLARDTRIKADAKALAWKRVAEAYAADNPYAGEADKALRQKIKVEAAHWETQAQLLALAPTPLPAQAANAPKAAGGSQSAAEQAFWDTVKNSPNPSDVQAFLTQYPESEFAPAARIRLKQLSRGQDAQQPGAALACPNSFAGKWTTTYGEMVVSLEGDRASAVYGYNNRHGELRGTLSGGVITGEWVETDLSTGKVTGRGPVRLTRSVDGTNFSGTWSEAGLFGKGGAWVGKCHP